MWYSSLIFWCKLSRLFQCARLGTKRSWNSLFHHGNVMEFTVQKEHKPWWKRVIIWSNTYLLPFSFVLIGNACFNNATGKLNLELYLGFIKNVTFHGLTNPHFKFDENGDPLAQYEIVNLQVRGTISATSSFLW